MLAFRTAVERGDFDAATALLAPDVRFRSPAVYKAYEGAEVVGHILRTVGTVFEDFTYTDQLTNGNRTVLFFQARVGEREVEGLDDITTGPDGTIVDFRVMVRPLSGLLALAEAMGAKLGAAE